jgi:hypothetical protein
VFDSRGLSAPARRRVSGAMMRVALATTGSVRLPVEI